MRTQNAAKVVFGIEGYIS